MNKEDNLTKKRILKRIEKERENIKKLGVKKIGLFGSYIKNKQNKKSDIDILVDFENKTFDSYAKLYLLLEELFKKKIDLIIKENLKPELNYVKEEVEYAKI